MAEEEIRRGMLVFYFNSKRKTIPTKIEDVFLFFGLVESEKAKQGRWLVRFEKRFETKYNGDGQKRVRCSALNLVPVRMVSKNVRRSPIRNMIDDFYRREIIAFILEHFWRFLKMDYDIRMTAEIARGGRPRRP